MYRQICLSVCPTIGFHANGPSKSLMLLMGVNGIVSPFSTVFCPVWTQFSRADANKNLLSSNCHKNWHSDNQTYRVEVNFYPYFVHLMAYLGDIQYKTSACSGVENL